MVIKNRKKYLLSEKGYTLIELLIIIAILGVLAGVAIPNVGRFMGKGQTEASEMELAHLQTAVSAMMVDNALSTLPNPVAVATRDMAAFPDATSAVAVAKLRDPDGNVYAAGDKDGYLLWSHDIAADGAAGGLVNYVVARFTKGTYTVDANGTVTQVTTGY